MAAFCAAEQGEAAATFGEEAADAAVDRMKNRLEALKRVQVPLPQKTLKLVQAPHLSQKMLADSPKGASHPPCLGEKNL